MGAIPVRVKSPRSFHRSIVTTVHSVGAFSLTESEAQPVVFGPATYRPFATLASGQLPLDASSTMMLPPPIFFQAMRKYRNSPSLGFSRIGKDQLGILGPSLCKGVIPIAILPECAPSLKIRDLPLPLVSLERKCGSSSKRTLTSSGQIAPCSTHRDKAAISLSESFSFGGICIFGFLKLIASTRKLFSKLPGTIAGPVSPPLSIAFKESSLSPPFCLSLPWQE